MDKAVYRTLLLIAAFIFPAACSTSLTQDKTGTKQEDMNISTKGIAENPVFDIVTDLGTIRVRLYSETPLHRDNFTKLVSEGYYNGVLFHRVIDGFMIQTGDPLTKDPSKADLYGTGGPGYTIPAEFNPALTHKKGALAAARRGDAANPKKESSGSQFYIVQDARNCRQLDGEYTVFGETLEGFDVIDSIAAVPTDRRDRPIKDIRIKYIKAVVPESREQVSAQDTTVSAPKDTTDAE